MVRRTFGLGTLVIREGGFDFQPAAQSSFEADRGDEARVGITFSYEEGSGRRNSGVVYFTVRASGGESTAQVKLRDLPGVKDEQKGFLELVLDLPEEGDVEVTYRIDAVLSDSSWMGGGNSVKSDFRHEGKLHLKVA